MIKRIQHLIRPEIRHVVFLWREVIAVAWGCSLGLWLFFNAALILQVLGIVLVLSSLLLAYPTIQRARFAARQTGPGVVEVTERQISYFGPVVGGSISLASLQHIAIRKSEAAGTVWVFTPDDEETLIIPVGAKGASDLFELLSALPGMQSEKMIRAVRQSDDQTTLIWARPRETRTSR